MMMIFAASKIVPLVVCQEKLLKAVVIASLRRLQIVVGKYESHRCVSSASYILACNLEATSSEFAQLSFGVPDH